MANRAAKLTATGVLLVVLMGACGWSSPPTDLPTPETQTVKGLITELEFGKMSFRIDDGRQLILEIANGPVPETQLQAWFEARQKLQVTYRAEAALLIPLAIVEAPPGSPAPSQT